ncbi:hypothetical protein BR1R3_37110 [Pseudomonas atacamensis]|jgi:hypothetical protein|uniref:DUF4406 domain-containing protein n=1 Tax=Pseudomonas atacamensis TaxID=2565368 RepID=UPI0022C6CCF3|nr:DUF4406 domain-containing protein [Pseudomonas atacamensis]GLH20969.1 hypothetical protein BR1R3_37110 [Pseudomonas atacamensis]
MPTENRNHPDDQNLIENLHQLHSERISDQLIALQDQAYAMGMKRGEILAKGRVTLTAARANRLYLAGPMTGFEDFNFPAFNNMAAELRARGYVIENPAEHGVVDGADWADYMAYDLTRLGLCGQVAVLPGWENSKGARLEVHIARELGMKVVNAHDLVSMGIAG